MPSAYRVPMASDVLPDPDTPTTATVRHSGTSTSMSCRLLCLAPRTPMTVGRVSGTDIASLGIQHNLRPRVGWQLKATGGLAAKATGGLAGGADLGRRPAQVLFRS